MDLKNQSLKYEETAKQPSEISIGVKKLQNYFSQVMCGCARAGMFLLLQLKDV